ncbi:hypothetical protein BU17DRAFT_97463 [Hysterangium stoloniferum]|nr:hypothetical protein BU17DRAFT_97463 [Hysterangium stoloniferum]
MLAVLLDFDYATFEQIESYFASLEVYLSSSFAGVAPDLPHVREIVNRIWADITRFGPPSIPQLPGLGTFEIPPPPPPPTPVPPPWSDSLMDWMGKHKLIAVSAGVGVVGAGLLTGYSVARYRRYCARAKRKETKDRREVVVILGADHPAGTSLVLGLEAQGYIVIASVSTPEAVDVLEAKAKGYVRALVLDPSEPSTVSYFLRSLQGSLSLRFPTTSHGDPYVSSTASPSSRPYIHSLISLLALFPAPVPTPLECLSLTDSYVPYFLRTHVTPLRVIQSLIPLFRRSSRFSGEAHTRKNIIVCVPAMAARVGVPFASEEAMSAAATVRAVEVLRRELKACAAQSNEEIVAPKVVLIDVGVISVTRQSRTVWPELDVSTLTQSWTPSERSAYASALEASLEQTKATPRTPAHVRVFVDAVVGVVSAGTKGRGYGYGYKSDLSLGGTGRFILGVWGRLRTWVRGERFSVGAGAKQYSLASYLPPRLLDFIIHLPHAIVSVRNALQPIEPPPLHSSSLPPLPAQHPPPVPPQLIENASPTSAQPAQEKEKEVEVDSSDAASEPDIESVSASGASESAAMGDSWVSLKDGMSSGAGSVKE